MSYLGHNIFLRSLKISGIIETKSRLHIGTGRDVSSFEETDSPLIRVNFKGFELPYIPGSSLKGIFRSTVEHLLNSVGEEVCETYDNRSSCFMAGKKILDANRSQDYNQLINAIKGLCLACKMFGGHNYSSHILISESIPIDTASVGFDISPNIAINRRDGTAIQGGLFTLEHINPNSRFNFQIQINNLSNYFVGLVFMVIDLLNNGIVLVGGNKRAGLGHIFITLDKIDFRFVKEGKDFSINYNLIDNSTFDNYKCERLEESESLDYDIIIPLSELKGKTKEEFSRIIIKYFMEAWNKYVAAKES